MADAIVQVAPDSTGKMVDNSSLTVGANTVYRQRLNIADPTTAAGLAVVINTTPTGSEYGLAVRLTGPLPAGTNTLGLIKITDGTNAVGVRPDGYINTRPDPTTLFFDTFETLDTTNSWTVSGSTAPTAIAGNAVANPGTAANATSIARTQASFIPGSSAYLQFAGIVQIETAVITGAVRFWGLGVPNGSPTVTTPILNGSVFEIGSSDGLLYGRVYSGGVKTQEVALTRPTDGAVHRYQIIYKASRVYYNIDNVDVGSIAFPNPAVAAFPAVFGTVNGGSVLGTATSATISLVGVGDTAKNSNQISDGTYPWRKAAVSASGALAVQGVSGGVAQPMTLTSSSTGGLTATFRPDGEIRVAMDATSLLLDTFETLNTTDTWTTAASGTGAAVTGSSGNLVVAGGTAASSYGSIASKAFFINGATAFTNYTSAWVIDASAITGNKRVFGLGVVNPSPTTAAPITNGVVFELQDTDGSMVGAVYSNGSRTATVPITRPTDGGAHRYNIFFRASRVYFELDSNAATTYSIALPNPQVDALSAVAVSVNAASGFPGTSPTLAASVIGIADTGRNNQQISDGTFAWRKATVKAGAVNPLSTDTALVTTPHPGSLATISTVNSTTANLGVSATFTGTTEDVTIYAQATVSVFANQASATDGLSIQQSTDGTNWDFFDVYSIPASTGKTFTIPVQARYMRIVYTNGAVAQTAFRLQTVYSVGVRRGSAVRPQDGRANDNDMEEVMSYLSAFNGTSWDRVRLKPASTAVAATDQALVVGLHPSSPLPAGTNVIGGTMGDIASGVTDGNAPVKIGGQARITNPTAVTDGQRVNAIYDKLGKQVVVGAIRDLKAKQITTITASVAETTIVTAGAAGVFNDVYGFVFTNTSATAINVAIREATAGTTIMNIAVPAADTRGLMLPVDSALPQATAASNWTATCSASITSLIVTALYVKNT